MSQTVTVQVSQIPDNVEVSATQERDIVTVAVYDGPEGPPGPTGPQGAPGPNTITTNTQTAFVGPIWGDAGYTREGVAGTDYLDPSNVFIQGANFKGRILESADPLTADTSYYLPTISGKYIALTATSDGTPNYADQANNAFSADRLTTARNIFGISFDGTANVSGDATNAGHFASIPVGGQAGHFITLNGTSPTVIAGRSAWWSDSSGNPSFRNGTGAAVTLATTSGNIATATAALGLKTATTTVSIDSATAPTSGQVLTATSSTSATWQTPTSSSVAVGNITGLGTGVATFLATPTSANLRAAITDETGTGALVFQDGNIGAATGTSLALGAGTVGVPSLNFGDAATGIYKQATDRIGFTSAGSLKMIVYSGGAYLNTGAAFGINGSNWFRIGTGGVELTTTTTGGTYAPLYISNLIASGAVSTTSLTLSSDAILTRKAAANIQQGAADAAAPVAQTFSVQSVVAGTSNTSGANRIISGSQGTGTGVGGNIIFQVAPAGSSGTAQNALVDALTISGTDKSVTLATPLPFTSGGTGLSAISTGGIIYGSGTNTVAALAGNTSTTMAVLTQTGNGSSSAAPVWTSTTGTGNVVRDTSPTITTGTASTASTTTPAWICSGPTSGVDTVQIKGTTTGSYSSIGFIDSSGTQRGSFGYGGSTAGSYASTLFIQATGGASMALATSAVERIRITTGGEVGIGTASPSSKSILDLTSTTKGFLPPRMTTTQRDAITSPPAGLMVYNSSTNKLNFYNGSAWEAVTSA